MLPFLNDPDQWQIQALVAICHESWGV